MAGELELTRLKLKNDFEFYARNCLSVRSKSGEVKQLLLNKAQRFINDCIEEQKKQTGQVRAIILKGRQQGVSTYVEGRYYWKTTHRKGVRAFILTHEADSTSALFEMVERYHQGAPDFVKPSTGASNQKELSFDKLDSGYKVGTAGNKSVGRGTTIQYFHGSEVAYWPNAAEHAKGILQAVPDEADTEIILESTANGVGNFFYQQWQQAEAGVSPFQAIFVPWYWQDEYRKPAGGLVPTDEEEQLIRAYGLDSQQLAFRRSKIAELSADGIDGAFSFRQEYPMTAQEAFQVTGGDSLIKPELVVEARKAKVLAVGPLIVGVDPARFGDDRTAIVRRKGRSAYFLETFEKRSTMEIAGIVHSLIRNENPAQVAVDVGGLGAGVVDRLMELGHEDVVVAINFGGAALDPQRFLNRRAEMWWSLRDWLDGDVPVMIPDRDDLHTDLCAPQYKYDSNARRKLESKDDIKKRGYRSTDCADALALTFAEPLTQTDFDNMIEQPTIVDKVAGY
tara:strand:- start:12762 stop:14285 length:1524 start_codon:yes stop_codon:yes gene_type:complete